MFESQHEVPFFFGVTSLIHLLCELFRITSRIDQALRYSSLMWVIYFKNYSYIMARIYGAVVCGYLNATSHYTRVNVTKQSKTS